MKSWWALMILAMIGHLGAAVGAVAPTSAPPGMVGAGLRVGVAIAVESAVVLDRCRLRVSCEQPG